MLAPFIFDTWTFGQVKSDSSLFILLIITSLFNGFWYSTLSILLATDKHKQSGVIFLIISTCSMLLAFWLAQSLGVLGVVGTLLLAEALMVVFVIRYSLIEVRATFFELMTSVVHLPKEFYVNIYRRVILNGK